MAVGDHLPHGYLIMSSLLNSHPPSLFQAYHILESLPTIHPSRRQKSRKTGSLHIVGGPCLISAARKHWFGPCREAEMSTGSLYIISTDAIRLICKDFHVWGYINGTRGFLSRRYGWIPCPLAAQGKEPKGIMSLSTLDWPRAFELPSVNNLNLSLNIFVRLSPLHLE